MALALTRIRGADLVNGGSSAIVLTGAGTITALTSLTLNISQATFPASSAQATFEQKSLGRKTMTGSYTAFRGTEGIPPALGDTVSVISLSVGTDEVTPTTIDDATVYGTVKVLEVEWNVQDAPMTYRVNFEAGLVT